MEFRLDEMGLFDQLPSWQETAKVKGEALRALLALAPKQAWVVRDGGEIVIFGSATERFANMFNAETRRTMADGLINPSEKLAWPVLEQALRQAAPGDDAGTEEPLPDLYPRHVPGS